MRESRRQETIQDLFRDLIPVLRQINRHTDILGSNEKDIEGKGKLKSI